MRLDKWLWVARFFKTRGLAADEIDKGRVQVNGQAAKPARAVRVNDLIEIRQPGSVRELLVLGPGRDAGAGDGGPHAVPGDRSQHPGRSSRPRRRRRFGVEPAMRRNSAGRPSATAATWSTGSAGAPRSTTQ